MQAQMYAGTRNQDDSICACRGSVRLYSDFYESDIIIASPLALATKMSEDEEEGEHLSWVLLLLVSVLCIAMLTTRSVCLQ